MANVANVSFGVLNFEASPTIDILSPDTGLPVTQNSKIVIANYRSSVQPIRHPNLARYLDCMRSKDERISLMFEYFDNYKPPENGTIELSKVTRQLLDALNHVHKRLNCAHGLLSPLCIQWTPDGNLKLTHWPINFLTNCGMALDAKTILPPTMFYVAPEQVKHPSKQPSISCDIWSAALLLLKMIKPNLKLFDNPCNLAFCETASDVINIIEGTLDESHVEDPDLWNALFVTMLHPNPDERATIADLFASLGIRPTPIDLPQLKLPLAVDRFDTKPINEVELDTSEIYHLWRISYGRNFETKQREAECPPIFKVPYLIITEDKQRSQASPPSLREYLVMDFETRLIPLERFKHDIAILDPVIYNPLVLEDDDFLLDYSHQRSVSMDMMDGQHKCRFNFTDLGSWGAAIGQPLGTPLSVPTGRPSLSKQISASSQPLLIKESDLIYQCERMVLFKRLISSCPYLKDYLIREASIDIPPYYRAETWALLLGVDIQGCTQLYESINKTVADDTEKQISVDIPRCHQYNDLMASPQGHEKLGRILKAWLNYNIDKYVYWQGLDSLAAPFMVLNFDNEALAFATFNAFLAKYMKDTFLRNNDLVIDRYLKRFQLLFAYHDGELAEHLDKVQFKPEHYALPWFLTMFTHVLPLRKIAHIWDSLLLADDKFPLCIGLAIMRFMRDELLQQDINGCLQLFGDLPEIDTDRLVFEANHLYRNTPEHIGSPPPP